MNNLSMGWMVLLVSMALIALATWFWWNHSPLRKKSLQLEVISLEQQYAEDIKIGKIVVVSEVIDKIHWSESFLFIITTFVMVFFASQLYGFHVLNPCQLYGGVVGFYLPSMLYVFFIFFSFVFNYTKSCLLWSSSKKDGYYPSRKILKRNPFVAYKITPEIASKQKRLLWDHGYFIVVLVALMSLVLYTSDPFQGTQSWHAANLLMQKKCLAKQHSNI